MKLTTTTLLALAPALGLANPIGERATSTSTSGYTSGATANDVTNGVCAPLTVIFARGTSESGNIGSVIGPPLFKALLSATNNQVALQGVNYAADTAGDADMGAEGAPNLVSLVQQALKQCPSTKIALSGYSQGAMVVHYAVQKSGLPVADVGAAVLFGDPGTSFPFLVLPVLDMPVSRATC